MKRFFDKAEKTIGGLKFAVIIILIFTIMMIVGTFIESYHGAEYAQRLIYKSWWFMLTQAFMGLSILFAAFRRLPPKKRLYGFYTIHAGLIVIACGAFITYIAGIDGQITLAPNEPERNIILPDDLLVITYPDSGRQITRILPNVVSKTDLDIKFEEFEFYEYLPYANEVVEWKEFTAEDLRGLRYENLDSIHSSQYFLSNDNFNQEFTLSRNPLASEFESNTRLGPLQVLYLPSKLSTCFQDILPSTVFVYNFKTGECFFKNKSSHLHFKETKSGKQFYVLKKEDLILTFFPNLSPYPMDENLEPLQDSEYRAFSTEIFQKAPALLLMGDKAAFFDKDEEAWNLEDLKGSDSISLPWMGFTLSLLKHETQKYPHHKPIAAKPYHKGGQLTKGKTRAINFKVKDKEYVVTDSKPVTLQMDGQRVFVNLTKDRVKLPFELVLDRFKMDKDPGTNSPASYESFVKLFTNEGITSHHIFMNNPMKFRGLTFYQASYSQDKNGNYISTLSVNLDQGRPLKYLGSILLVLGCMWHYHLNKKRSSAKKAA